MEPDGRVGGVKSKVFLVIITPGVVFKNDGGSETSGVGLTSAGK